ncbi:DUF488 domain-containing protein [Yoonia sediminilitoris]|uniref:Uncharacterized protein DUF488 n=1 Tax=Yoonia sediminilitoris TaxID=1286148 RepID=A0A2T6KF20_9RHOB|nr:DUF488 domain-containing protein [Yoonia sediminilitoris]PUB13716.1 uncharacterized protein DUF488 [Yoonia sediminilitoris]RCW94886.1 uncharacterized protein DUF488 [Yoonia sediminilitoris]
MKIYTIGFTKSTARDFFGRLNTAGVKHVYDTRLNRTSQLSGFAKQKDLDFFLSKIGGINYSVDALLAPTADILSAFRKNEISWVEYERRYLDLLSSRKVEKHFDIDQMHEGCLLCSEATPEHCHRRLAANYLAQARTDVEIVHL